MASLLKKRAPQWGVKAKQQLAIWKQHLLIAKAIVQSEIIVQCVTPRGLAIDDLRSHNFRELLEFPIYAVVCQETEAEIEKSGRNIEVVEDVVYASFLVDAAKEVGIEVEKVREYPYFRSPATKDQAMQASFPCLDCVAPESSMMTDESELRQGEEEEANLQNSEEDQS